MEGWKARRLGPSGCAGEEAGDGDGHAVGALRTDTGGGYGSGYGTDRVSDDGEGTSACAQETEREGWLATIPRNRSADSVTRNPAAKTARQRLRERSDRRRESKSSAPPAR